MFSLSHRNPKWGSFDCLKIKARQGSTKKGIVLLSDIFGISTDHTHSQAENLSAQGWTCLVPDLFAGNPHPFPLSTYSDLEREAWRSRYAYPYDRAIDVARTCTEYLREEEGTPIVGMVGYCYGGGRLVDVLASDVGGMISAGVAFYGTRINPELVGEMGAPAMLIFGEKDPLVEPSLVEKIREKMVKEKGEVIVFKDRGHGFVHMPNEGDADDSQRALEMSYSFLNSRMESRQKS